MRSLLVGPLAALIGIAAACSDDTTAGPSTNLDAGTPSTADSGPVASGCTPASGGGTTHDAVTASETWSAAASPHTIKNVLDIPVGVTVTIEACATVVLDENAGILVEGMLLAKGSRDAASNRLISFQRRDAGKAWSKIEVRQGGYLSLNSTMLFGGGNLSAGPDATTIDVRGDQLKPTQPSFDAHDVTIRDSAGIGVTLREGGGFTPTSLGLTIEKSGSYPVSAWGRAAGTIPSGAFTTNKTDKIFLPAIGGYDDVQDDATFKNLGVPYFIAGNALNVGATSGQTTIPLLTIEQGTTLQFAKLSRLLINGDDKTASGALAADGVTFTSAEAIPAAGDWVGIIARGVADPRTKITSSTVAYAGANSNASSYGCPSALASDFGDDGAIVILGAKPNTVWVTNTKIENSKGDGIVRGWTGTELDFLATNTFTSVLRCNQTFPKPENGVCPAPAPCPK